MTDDVVDGRAFRLTDELLQRERAINAVLLKACREALPVLDSYVLHRGDWDEYGHARSVMRDLRAAIAKAEEGR